MTVEEIQNEIIEEFELFDNWNDKYAYIIDLGKKLPILAEDLKTEDRLIKGCQSRVWLYAYLEEYNVRFQADSDAIIVKGLIYLLLRVFDNHPINDIVNSELFFLEKIGMAQHLSPTRANGLVAMVKQIKLYALAFQAKQNAS